MVKLVSLVMTYLYQDKTRQDAADQQTSTILFFTNDKDKCSDVSTFVSYRKF
jgi:hypothetical protein